MGLPHREVDDSEHLTDLFPNGAVRHHPAQDYHQAGMDSPVFVDQRSYSIMSSQSARLIAGKSGSMVAAQPMFGRQHVQIFNDPLAQMNQALLIQILANVTASRSAVSAPQFTSQFAVGTRFSPEISGIGWMPSPFFRCMQ